MNSPLRWRVVMAYVILCPFLLRTNASSQKEDDHTPFGQKFSLHGYGVMNYFGFNWQTDPDRRNAIDIERLVLYPGIRLSSSISVQSEIEFEHGGTGTTMEFDRFEEFGEFESEIEKGGEVVLDQLHVQIELSRLVNFRIGRIKLPVGLLASKHEPGEYFTTTRSEMETSVIPSIWYENGIEYYGSLFEDQALRFHFLIVNGLDATGFSSANWIARGHQTRFEFVNAENLAFAAALTFSPSISLQLGISGYFGNSSDNRPKPDLLVTARVSVIEAHAQFEHDGLQLRTMGLYGTLGNADLVTKANRNLSNNLNVKRTPVGSAAAGFFVEGGYNVLALWQSHDVALTPFIRWEYYDSMAKTAGDIFDNPRWERYVTTAGVNLKPIDDLVFKAQYSVRKLGIPAANLERTFSLGVGFQFD